MKYLITFALLFSSQLLLSQVYLDKNIQIKCSFTAETSIDSALFKSDYFKIYDPNTGERMIVDFPDVQPRFEGRFKDFEPLVVKSFNASTKDLKKALRKNSEVKVVIKFLLSEKSEISELKVIRGISKTIDAEIARVIKSGDWRSGEHQGMPISYLCTFTIVFSK